MNALTRTQAIETLTAPGQFLALNTITVNPPAGQHGKPRQCRWFDNGPSCLRQLYTNAVLTGPDLPFIDYEQERVSFSEAWQQACALSYALVMDYGVMPGDRVAISMRNYPEWMIAFMAVTAMGGVAVAMNALWQQGDMSYALKDSGARVLIADQERLDKATAAGVLNSGFACIAVRCAHVSDLAQKGIRSWQDVLAPYANKVQMPLPEPDIDATAMILYTSGSTGNPKGVPTTHRMALSALLSWELDMRAAEMVMGMPTPPPTTAQTQATTLLAVPLFHVTGLNAVFLISFRTNRRIVSMYKWNALLAAEMIERERINSVVAPAAMTGDLVRAAKESKRDLSSLLVVGGGGAPRAAEQVRQIGSSFGNAMPNTGWGMTETSAIGVGIGGPDYLAHPLSSGRCSAVLELRIVDEQGIVQGVGQRGELLIRGTSVMFGYWNKPEANAQSFVADDDPRGPWFKTGDVAYLDSDGYLYIVDRIKDLIIRGGENIGCGPVEDALLAHPKVREVAVYAVPDERLGEEVGASIFADDDLDETALREFLAQRLAKHEVPRYIFQSATPLLRTPSGKVLKRQLREQALQHFNLGESQGAASQPAWFQKAVAQVPRVVHVSVQGASIETLSWGTPGKPGIVLMHGNFAHAHWYSALAPLLAQEFHVVALSFSGKGGSSHREAYSITQWADEAMACAQHHGLFQAEQKPVFVGHSFGGFPLMNITARFGDQLKLAIIADSPIRTKEQRAKRQEESPRRLKAHRVYSSVEEGMKRFRLVPTQTCANTYLVEHIARHSLGQVQAGERINELEANSPAGWTWQFDPFIFNNFSMGKPGADLSNAKCPVAWVNGANSSLITDEVKANIRQYSPPGTRVIEIAEADHHVLLDQPLVFVETVAALARSAM